MATVTHGADRPQATSDIWAQDSDSRCSASSVRSRRTLPDSLVRAVSRRKSAGIPTLFFM